MLELRLAPSGSNDTALPRTTPFPAPPRIVGLTGLAGCGKSTVAEYLQAKYGYVRVRFAEPLKRALVAMGASRDEIDGALKTLPSDFFCDKTPREAMQWLGTEWGRKLIGPNFWVNAWKRAVDEALAYRHVVADDARFHNETDAIKRYGGLVVHIERPSLTLDAKVASHESERYAATLPHDIKIVNDGTIDDLYQAIENHIIRGRAIPKAAA